MKRARRNDRPQNIAAEGLHRLRLRRRLQAAVRTGPSRREDKVKADINVTPLVDVVLVLLIIFMVVTPDDRQRRAGRAAPDACITTEKPDDGKDIIISVTANKTVSRLGTAGPGRQGQ